MKKRLKVLCLLSFLFLITASNVFTSITLFPLVPRVVLGETQSVITFLKTIRYHQQFPEQLAIATEKRGVPLRTYVFEEETARKDRIGKVEQLRKRNPKSRDVLLELAQLHLMNGNREKAYALYTKAQLIDPWLSVASFEKLR